MPFTETAEQQALVDRVESRMDEVTPTDQTPTVPHAQIYAELEDATRYILQEAPLRMVMEASENAFAILNIAVDNTRPKVTIAPLPVTYLRLLRIRLTTWDRPYDGDPLETETDEHRRQYNDYQGATARRPRVFLAPHHATVGGTKWALECFPKNDIEDPVAEALIITTTTPEDAPSLLIDPIVWEAAARVLSFFPDRQAPASTAREKRDEVLYGRGGSATARGRQV